MEKDKKTTKKTDPSLDKVMIDFNSHWEYVSSNWHNRWSDNFKLYNNVRVKVGYEGITDTFVPMTFSTIETMTSALFGTKPRFDYVPPHTNAEQSTEILNSLLDYYWDKDQWSMKVINWGRDMLRFGTSVIYMHWDGDHPAMVNVPIRDFFVDPMATTLDNARWMGRRYLTTIDELESFEIYDTDKEKMVPRFKNIDEIQLGKSDGTGENTDKEEKDMYYGSTVSNPEDTQVEVIEYWTKDKCISIANRTVVIESKDNWYKPETDDDEVYSEGIMPFAVLRDYVDGSLFYSKGEIDFIADSQELLNDITNQNIDSVTYTLNQMYTLDPAYADMLEQIENVPGAVYLAPAGALQPIPQRSIDASAYNERLNIKNEIRETTASNEVVKGVSGEDNATATEINAQIAGAGQRLNLKITQIEDEGFYQLARIVFAMVRMYVTEKTMVRVVGKDGARWEEFEPSEFKDGDYEPKVQLEISVQNQKAFEADQSKEMLAAFLGDPEINQTELKKMAIIKGFDLEPDEVDKLFSKPEEMAQPEQPPMPEAMPPEMMMPPMPLPPEQPPMGDYMVDPVTGELMPVSPELDESQMLI